jgi:histone acetyltransferase 1
MTKIFNLLFILYNLRYLTVAYLSVYNFYAYPDKTRMRVSQLLTLPPYQRAGHAAELLEAVYRDAANNPEVVDVTAEAPSEEFVSLRDFVSTKLCSTLSSFRNVDKLRKGFSAEMAAEALKCYKIPKLQSRRSYEIVRMATTDENNADLWNGFCVDIKKRLYSMFLKYSKFARNSKSLASEESSTKTPETTSDVSKTGDRNINI